LSLTPALSKGEGERERYKMEKQDGKARWKSKWKSKKK
jgi:hypothetical protein